MDQPVTRRIDPPRLLSEAERALVLFLLSKPAPGRDAFVEQVKHVRVWGECLCGCGTIDLLVTDPPEGLTAPGRTIISEAWNRDRPDAPVQVQLHTVNGVLRELEVVWFTDGRSIDAIAPAALTLGSPGTVPAPPNSPQS